MTETLVFMFLLDQLPGNELNKTYETVNVTHTSPPEDMKCNVQITDPLLQVISRELDRVMVPEWLLNPNGTEKFHAESDASFAARFMDTVRIGVSNSVETTNSTEVQNESSEFDPSDKVVNVGSANQEVTGPEKTPMLVAIFETVSNVTAQTCAGTLLAPNWVLTSASCVHLLNNATRNSTNATEDSIYTIIVNATDPLIDGTAHNVTQIVQYPENNDTHDAEVIHGTKNPERNATENVFSNATDDIKNNSTNKNGTASDILKIPDNQNTESIVDALEINVTKLINNVTATLKNLTNNIQQSNKTNVTSNVEDVPSNSEEIPDSVEKSDADNVLSKAGIALMRIHPPVPMENVNIVSQTDETNVTVYGWVMREEDSEQDSMHELALYAQTLSPRACAAHYNITPAAAGARARADLCLASQDLALALDGQMSWGGPVVTPTGDVLGVSRGDGSAPLSATPLAPYADWIRSIINTNSSSS